MNIQHFIGCVFMAWSDKWPVENCTNTAIFMSRGYRSLAKCGSWLWISLAFQTCTMSLGVSMFVLLVSIVPRKTD